MEQEEIKTADASTFLEVYVECPYCDFYQERLESLREHLDYGSLSAEKCDAELTCENKDCGKTFIVTSISY